MRLLCVVQIFGCCGLTSCVTHVSGVAAYGLVWTVSADDIRSAVAADQHAQHDLSQRRIDHVTVAGPNTIEIYHQPNSFDYCDIRRVGGRWRYTGGFIILE